MLSDTEIYYPKIGGVFCRYCEYAPEDDEPPGWCVWDAGERMFLTPEIQNANHDCKFYKRAK